MSVLYTTPPHQGHLLHIWMWNKLHPRSLIVLYHQASSAFCLGIHEFPESARDIEKYQAMLDLVMYNTKP